ncbi:MAG TPA: MBL fold metallo-hydrolase [Chloroflexota bacterium]|jgi:glyoxylase-like metal-dependent hydrolase (beta-lactamase superfamily II)|nr:MBL fold metallo-hydrolase [Chloroflexota bacterium]
MTATHRAAPFRLGSLNLQPVSDGLLWLPAKAVFPDVPESEWRPHVHLDDQERLELALTCLLVTVGDRRIVIDTGFGERPDNPRVGHLIESLAELGVSPEQIDTVVVSHPHADHIGGATHGSGDNARLTFPQARYWLSQTDWDAASPPAALAERAGLADKLLPLANTQHLDLANGELDIAPGVRLLPLPGHTPGHMGVAFTSGQEMAIYVGDMIHHPLQVEHPDWTPVFDALPAMARQTRAALLERARREASLVLSYHLPWPGIGHIGSAWEPLALNGVKKA